MAPGCINLRPAALKPRGGQALQSPYYEPLRTGSGRQHSSDQLEAAACIF